MLDLRKKERPLPPKWCKSALMASLLASLSLCSGCALNHAVVSSEGYTSCSHEQPWVPVGYEKQKPLQTVLPVLEAQALPYSLAEVISLALKYNPYTKWAWASAQAAAAQYGQSQSPLLPALSGTLTYNRLREPEVLLESIASPIPSNSAGITEDNVEDAYASIYGPQLQLSYVLFDFGTRRASSEVSRQLLFQADWVHNTAIQQLLQAVMHDFYQYLYQKSLQAAYEENVATAQLTLNAAMLGLRTGVRDVSDTLQAQVQLLARQTQLSNQQLSVETAYVTLLNTMGIPATLKLSIQDFPDDVPKLEEFPHVSHFVSVAFNNRPDLFAKTAALRAQDANVNVAYRQWLPELNYNFELGKTYFGQGLHDNYNFISQFQLSFPLFQGLYYKNAIRLAKAQRLEAEEELNLSEVQITGQVTQHHYAVLSAQETYSLDVNFLQAAQEQYEVSLAAYKQGTNTILDLVSAQSMLSDARASISHGKEQVWTSLADLIYAVGLLSPTDVKAWQPLLTGESKEVRWERSY